MPLFPFHVLLKISHPERSECKAFAKSKDLATFSQDDLRRIQRRMPWTLRRLPLSSGGPDYFVVRAREARRKRIISP